MKNNGGIVKLLEKICLVSDLDGDLNMARDKWPKNLFYRARKNELKKPDYVAYPAKISEISEILKIANCRSVPVVPFGGGSGVLGAANSEYGGIAIDMMRMDKLTAIDEMNLTATFQAGILGEELERQLNERGYSLGHFPASIAISTLGGWLATRSSGQYATKYGKIEDMVLGMKVVLASGEILDLRPKPGHSLGPDLIPLFIGSEGTLGVIVEATLKIMPLPRFR
ncbi:MAG: FAD-binding oxidoreductase, partial [Patescibacteria group bacterium]